MPAHIVIVHNDPAFLDAVCAALSASGNSVLAYSDAMQALDALEDATTIEVLVTRVDFGRGKLNGVALARMAQFRRAEVKVLFVARTENKEYTTGVGDLLTAPAAVPDVVAAVDRLLAEAVVA
jgi:DNA-binding NtrC family response regulator